MAKIVLTTLNAKFIHSAFGLRYLMANLGPLRSEATLIEFDINQRAIDIVERLLAEAPTVVGIGVYIWNAGLSAEVVALLKRIRSDLIVIVGGPEVSYETEEQPIVGLADYVLRGEADLTFAALCERLLRGERPKEKVLPTEVANLNRLELPYDLYDDRDVAHRVIYVEASRGCPFTCEFCLSSLGIPVRQFPLPQLLEHLERLLARGVMQFKFVDRTFNLSSKISKSILEFFLERYQPGLFLHFEMIPDRLPEALREPIREFPAGALQFEVGIQTFNDQVAERIKRRQDYQKLAENFRFLREETGVHIHADLIVGLPGESIESFGAGFDRLITLRPQEIQVGMLKRLRGTPIVRHDAEWQMTYSPLPPYEILQNTLIDFAAMQRMRRFARYWDVIANSGNFIEATPLIWKEATSPFAAFMVCSQWLFAKVGRCHSLALGPLTEWLFEYLTQKTGQEHNLVAEALARDYTRTGRTDLPRFLSSSFHDKRTNAPVDSEVRIPKRQARHIAANHG